MLIPVRQLFPHRGLPDVSRAVRDELDSSGLARRLKPGASVAIGVGSRGITNLPAIVRTVVEYFTANGLRPFLFPAMGSHGAGTAEGQAHVLAHYGIDEAHMGCPVKSSFDVISLGQTDLGIEAFAGKDAWESDGIFLVSRVKWHTSFSGVLESGVSKMIAIGMGKQPGAKSVHSHGRRLGMDVAIRSVAARVAASGKLLGGLAILEDAWHDTGMVAALPAGSLIAREIELLRTVKTWMGRIPVPEVDVLIVDEIGKNISGTGMDLKVVNRNAFAHYNPWPDTPLVQRIFVRDLSELSNGNATGIGAADVCHDRVFEKLDPAPGRVNAVTSGSLALARIPLHFPTDEECFECVAYNVGKVDLKDVTVAWIRNTLELSELSLSENLVEEIAKNPLVEIAGAPFELNFG